MSARPPQQKRPFRMGTRRRFALVGSQAYSAGAVLNFELPRVGYLDRIYVVLRGTNNIGSASALADLGPWNAINRIRCNINIGSNLLVDLSGYGAYLIGSLIERGSMLNKAGIGDTVPHADVYAASVSSGNQTWALSYLVPISANDGDNCELGTISLQAPELRFTVEVTCGANGDPVTVNGTGFASTTVYVYYDYWEVPNLATTQQPPLILCRTLEELMSVTAVGDNIYTVPRMGTVIQLLHYFRANGARSDGIDSFQLRFNKTDSIYKYDRWAKRIESRVQDTVEWPVGVYLYDLWHAMGNVSQGDFRDAIDSEAISTFESIITVSSGTTLGSGNNYINSIRRIVQKVQR